MFIVVNVIFYAFCMVRFDAHNEHICNVSLGS
jgi:hypothetical protein